MDNLIQKMSEIYSDLYNSNNLIHCLTNAISINDMANAVLSVNQSPFMADNPREVEDVTKNSDSLLVNLGNITDYRIESIKKSVRIANENNIPITLDLVGVSASKLRLDFTLEILQKYTITCIKGNYSEIKSLFSKDLSTKGVDSRKLEVDDVINYCNNLHEKYHSIVVATGHTDIVCSDEIYLLNNGDERLSKITATGCVVGSLIACTLSVSQSIEACVLGVTMMNISCEMVDKSVGLSSFKIGLYDNLSKIKWEQIKENINARKVES